MKSILGMHDKTARPALVAIAASLLFAGCVSENSGSSGYVPLGPDGQAFEGTQPILLADPALQHSITTIGRPMARTLEDGRLEVTAQLRNLENRRLEVQANCVFKDVNGQTTGDETPFRMVILTENSSQQIQFVSINNLARLYTIHVRQAR